MNSNEQEPEETRPEVRYVVLLDPSRQVGDVDLAGLDLDRLPDREGVLRFLVGPGDLEELRDRNLVLDVAEELPVRGLDQDLVYSDEEAMAEFERRLEGIEHEEGS